VSWIASLGSAPSRLFLPLLQAPTAIGPGKPSVAGEMIQEMDADIGMTIFDGGILDYPY
jgi:hypothetical protein